MHIKSIDLRQKAFNDGLGPLHLYDLSRIVILAGPNGSGKSRILNRIHELHGTSPNRLQIELVQRGADVDSTTILKDRIKVVPFTVRSVNLVDASALSPKNSLQQAKAAETPGMEGLNERSLSYIQRTQQRWWDALHPESLLSAEEKKIRREKYETLDYIIYTTLGVRLSRDDDGIPTLFGRQIAQAGLSHGQRALLQWCVGLHAQETQLNELILLMDEPENHLHPEALIAAVGRIVDANHSGQVWIGTHSVPLIASLCHRYPEDVSLYFIENGIAHFSGRSPEKVLMSLMGGEKNIHALREFIDLPVNLATNRFAAECLLPPKVVSEANANDPQANLASTALFEGIPDTVKPFLLDFGAGDCRLLNSFAAADDNIPQRLEYVAWDVCQQANKTCSAVIRRVYGADVNRWFNDLNQIVAQYSTAHFDAAVMCNVLHEIEPSKWVSTFKDTGVLRTMLKPFGSLVIVEDYLMPKGEYAHPYGFIVLDTAALQKLFGCSTQTASIRVISANGERYKDRIKAHIVPVELLKNVTTSSVKAALEYAAQNARTKIEALRSSETKDYKSGQAHAFWVQQFTNATIALEAHG